MMPRCIWCFSAPSESLNFEELKLPVKRAMMVWIMLQPGCSSPPPPYPTPFPRIYLATLTMTSVICRTPAAYITVTPMSDTVTVLLFPNGLSFVPECEDAIAFRVEKWQGTGRSLPRGWGPPGGGPARRHHCRRLPAPQSGHRRSRRHASRRGGAARRSGRCACGQDSALRVARRLPLPSPPRAGPT